MQTFKEVKIIRTKTISNLFKILLDFELNLYL